MTPINRTRAGRLDWDGEAAYFSSLVRAASTPFFEAVLPVRPAP
jgi:hypothetical protein